MRMEFARKIDRVMLIKKDAHRPESSRARSRPPQWPVLAVQKEIDAGTRLSCRRSPNNRKATEPVGEGDLFDIEYWSLEQAKLGQAVEKPLAGQAATLFLMKQYALEYGSSGIRSNAVNADGIRSGIMTPDYIKTRAAAYGISEAQYMARNLLGREVTAEDVAEAFLAMALARSTTGSFATVDGGNLAAAPR